ncbi:MAG: class I SAM-dependent methyltransferase [Candidatus Thermoplasmatota archaeon]|nr:class I SAM-dependent methyltransferase [Candidatus Thermoplasmatota archaeon]
MTRIYSIDRQPRTYDIVLTPMEAIWFGRRRRKLLSGLKGHVLDIGSGTGANLGYYPETVECVTVIDPSHDNIRYLKRKARGGGWGVEGGRCLRSRLGFGEKLPFRSNSFDNVVSTLILCTVEDPSAVISEGVRVLKKGGKFIFIEHQLPRLWPQALLFKALTPLWRAPSGCNLNRHTEDEIRKRREIRNSYFERWGPVLGYPFFAGVYERR